jgi:hypothetical protein
MAGLMSPQPDEEEDTLQFGGMLDLSMPTEDAPAVAPTDTPTEPLTEELTYGGVLTMDEPQEPSQGVLQPDALEYGGLLEVPTEKSTTISRADMLKPENYNVVAAYMFEQSGMTEADFSKEEILDSFYSRMRSFAAGNSITTASEVTKLATADDTQRAVAGRAYQLYDSIENVFQDDTATVGDRVESVYEHGKALILDPINIVGPLVGKLFAVSGAKGVATLAQQAGRAAAQTAAKQVATKAGDAAVRSTLKGLGGRALTEAETTLIRTQAMEAALAKPATKAAVASAERLAYEAAIKAPTMRGIMKTAGATTAVDAVINVGVDYAAQQSYIMAGVQEDYSVLQGGLSAVGAMVGGGLSLMLSGTRGVSKLPMATTRIEELTEAAKDVTKVAARVDSRKAVKGILKDFDIMYRPFDKKVSRGRFSEKFNPKQMDTEEKYEFFKTLFMGNTQLGIKGLYRNMMEAGITTYIPRHENDNLSNFVFDVLDKLPIADKKEITDTVVANLGPDYKNMSLRAIMDSFANDLNYGARVLNLQSQLSRAMSVFKGKSLDDSTVDDVTEMLLDPVDSNIVAKLSNFVPDTIDKLQRNLIRMIVTNPATTALNVKGWAFGGAAQSASDVVRATLYSGTALGNLLVGRKQSAIKYARMSKQMLALQKQRAQNFVDPNMTYEAAMSYWASRPKVGKDMMRYIAGGIENVDIYKSLGLTPDAKLTKGFGEKYMDFFQNIYLVKGVDVVSKTQEFMYAIDKQIRLKYNMSYAEFMSQPDALARMTGTEFVDIETRAVSDALSNVFGKSFGDGTDALAGIAKNIEDLRKLPIIGAMAPFGQFFNNTVSFMSQYSGVSFMHKAFLKGNQDPWELASKAAVGWGVTAMYFYPEAVKNLEEGNAWHEKRNADGSLVSQLYDFPISPFKMAAHMMAIYNRDGAIPKDLLVEAAATFGPAQLTRQLSDSAQGIADFIVSVAEGDTTPLDAIGGMLQTASTQYISGFTRHLEPLNVVAATARGRDYVPIDRNAGNEFYHKSARYVDEVFALLSGEPAGMEKKSAITDAPAQAGLGKMLGQREVAPHSLLQYAFRTVGRPDYMTKLKSYIPEANNAVNGIIFPIAEDLMGRILDTDRWKNGDTKTRNKLIDDTLKLAKEEALARLAAQYNVDDNIKQRVYDLTKRGAVPEKELRRMMDALNMQDMEITDLSLNQLDLLEYYIKDKRAYEKILNKEAFEQ